MESSRFRRLVLCAFAATLVLVSCSGKSSGPAGGVLPAADDESIAHAVATTVTFNVLVPLTGGGAAAQSVTIGISGQTPVEQDVVATSPGCSLGTGGTQCVVQVPAVVGIDTFVVTSYTSMGGTGSVVATALVTKSIVASPPAINLDLGGTLTKLAVVFQGTPPPEGKQITRGLTVMGKDASGAIMVGPDPYPSPVTLSDTDPLNTTTLSTTSVTSPTTLVSVTYSGAPLGSAGANALFRATSPTAGTASVYFYTSTFQWTTWGGAPNRNMYNANEHVLGKSNVAGLHQIWSKTATGVFTGAPIVVANITTSNGPLDLLYTGDEHATMYALNAGTGAQVWSRTLNTQTINPQDPTTPGCQDLPGGIYGVSESPVYDRSTNRIYVVDALGDIYGFDAGSGTMRVGPTVLYPYLNGVNITNVYGGLTLDPVNGVIYVARGAHCGLQNYGGVTRYTTATGAIAQFYTEGLSSSGTPNTFGGVWGPGGVSLDPRFARNSSFSDIYFATGDGQNTPPKYGESVLRLNESLAVVGHANPTNQCCNDLDLGDTPLVFQPTGGCGKTLVVATAKTGGLYLYDADNITGGALQTMQIGTGSSSGVNIATASYDPVTNHVYIANGSDSSDPTTHIFHGLLAFHVTALCSLSLDWQNKVGPNNSTDGPPAPPTIANGVVYYADGPGVGCSPIGQPHCVPGMTDFFAFDTSTGQTLFTTQIKGPIFTPPVEVNGHVYLESWNGFGPGVIYGYGL